MRPHRSLILVAALISSAQAFTVATAPIAGPGAKPLKTCLGSLGHRRSVVSQAAKLGLCVALALGSPPNAEAKIAEQKIAAYFGRLDAWASFMSNFVSSDSCPPAIEFLRADMELLEDDINEIFNTSRIRAGVNYGEGAWGDSALPSREREAKG